jgi:hypothetical protein
MGSKQIDLIGKVFSRLTVIRQEESILYGKTKKRIWLCKCLCGKELLLSTGALTSGNTKSCGCLHDEVRGEVSRKTRKKLADPDSGYKSIMNSYKNNALKRGYDFDLSFEEFKQVVISDCYYCNIEPSNLYSKNYYNVLYNGIDRVNNNFGYTLSNIVPCCKSCNVAKNNKTYEEFLEWINRFVKKEIINLVKITPNNQELGEKIRRLVS